MRTQRASVSHSGGKEGQKRGTGGQLWRGFSADFAWLSAQAGEAAGRNSAGLCAEALVSTQRRDFGGNLRSCLWKDSPVTQGMSLNVRGSSIMSRARKLSRARAIQNKKKRASLSPAATVDAEPRQQMSVASKAARFDCPLIKQTRAAARKKSPQPGPSEGRSVIGKHDDKQRSIDQVASLASLGAPKNIAALARR
jgi:hypothetical protein